jgi:transposase
MTTLFGLSPFLLKLYADGDYQGQAFQKGVKKAIARVNMEIVKRSDPAKGFVVLPKRWIVERTFAWLGCCRRLACLKGTRSIKDWECLNAKALAFLKLVSIRLMIRRLCNPS